MPRGVVFDARRVRSHGGNPSSPGLRSPGHLLTSALAHSLPKRVRTKYCVSKNSRMALIRPSWMENTETMFAS